MLKNVVIQNKTIEVEYPYVTGCNFKVDLAYLTKDAVLAIKRKATKVKKERYSAAPIETLDEDKFTELFIKETIKGWSGFTYKALSQMLPIDIEVIKKDTGKEDEQEALATEIDYSLDDALFLIRNSIEFDEWVNDTCNDLDVFTTAR